MVMKIVVTVVVAMVVMVDKVVLHCLMQKKISFIVLIMEEIGIRCHETCWDLVGQHIRNNIVYLVV